MFGCKVNDPLETLLNFLKENIANMPLTFYAQQFHFERGVENTIVGKKRTNVRQQHLKGIELGTNLSGKKSI